MSELQGHGFVGFGLAEVGFAYPMMQTAVTDVASIRRLKAWTPDNDPSSLQAYQAFDITPIPLPIADVLAGLQTGLINSIASPPIGAIALQWYTQVEYAIELPLLYVYGLFALDAKAFNRLTPAQQEIVRAELSAGVAHADATARADHASAKGALAQQGIQWLNPSPDEFAEWERLAGDARARIVAEGFISEDIYAELERLLAEYRASNPE